MNAAFLLPLRRYRLLARRIRAWVTACYLYIRHLQWLQRPALERLGRESARIVKEAWLILVETANKIQTAESWKAAAQTWDDYCRLTWGISSSHLSHFRSAAPYAHKLIEAGTNGQPLLEAHLRRFKKHVPLNHPLMPQAFLLGNQVAGKNAPTPAVYRRSLEVLEEAEKNQGFVQVGDKTFFVSDTESAVSAVKETLSEVKKIKLSENLPIEVTARRLENGAWELEADQDLPPILKFKAYI